MEIQCPRGGRNAVLAIGLAVTGYLAANTEMGNFYTTIRFYSPVPFLLWAAMRFGVPGSSGSVLLVALFAVEAAINGKGPFRGLSPGGTALTLQNFFLLRSTLMSFIALSMERSGELDSLRESEVRFRRMAQTAPVMIWMSDADRSCKFVNQGWLDFTGGTIEQELGDGWADRIHPDDAKNCLEHYQRAFDAREKFEFEWRHGRSDGAYRWILSKGIRSMIPGATSAAISARHWMSPNSSVPKT